MITLLTKSSDPITNHYKKGKVIALNKHANDDVILLIEGTAINCFVSYCPYTIEIGETYDIELTLNLSDDYEIERVEPRKILVEKANYGYCYFLYGELLNETFLTFTSLSDEDIHYEHPECNEHFIKLKVQRIDASFR